MELFLLFLLVAAANAILIYFSIKIVSPCNPENTLGMAVILGVALAPGAFVGLTLSAVVLAGLFQIFTRYYGLGVVQIIVAFITMGLLQYGAFWLVNQTIS